MKPTVFPYFDYLALQSELKQVKAENESLKRSDASKEQCTIDQQNEIKKLRTELKQVMEERSSAVALIETVNRIAIDAIEEGPFQDGEEAQIFCKIDQLTRQSLKRTEEGEK